MLYVFHVDTGTMMTFEMSLALESVSHLKQYVERACKIPADKQVLLVSGGECLDPNARVCSYSAGTDTNPIFLFSKSIIESTTPPCPSVDYGSDTEFKEKVRESQDLPATYNTVVKRSQLAQQLHEMAKEQTKICEGLVHDQHLQQQGWSAVVANLEDITAEFKRRSEIFEKSFNDYMKDRDSYLKFLQYFSQDLATLEKIPVLPILLESAQAILNEVEMEKMVPEETTLEEEAGGEKGNQTGRKLSLLEWISSADNKSSMDQLLEHCTRGLEQFDEKVFEVLHAEVEKVLENADSSQMKEVKGLGDRLFGLEQLMREAKKYVQEQAVMAQSFLQNQTRAGNLGDASILPDLCISHRKQLLVMLQNHQQLCDIKRRCTRAKEELSINLYHRLKWVMYIENSLLETDQKLVIYHESLRRLRRHLEVLQQIHLAPATYLSAIAEVVRRRVFSQAFLLWASELACHLMTIHNEEVARRKDFLTQFEGHFLNSLFPGMEDLPPTFATQAPSIFDSSLPKITMEDVEFLKAELPELAEHLNVADTSAITNFFVVKSVLKAEELDKVDEAAGVEEKLVQVVNEVGLASNLDQNMLKAVESDAVLMANVLPHLKDLDKGCESETDTEEFEKVGQSPLDLHFDKDIPSPRPGTQDAATLTEDNLQISRGEHEKLQTLLVKMSILARQTINHLKQELNELKERVGEESAAVKGFHADLAASFVDLNRERGDYERELVQKMTIDHELEVSDFRKMLRMSNEHLKALGDEFVNLKGEMVRSDGMNAKIIQELREEVQSVVQDKEKALKEMAERLNREHKAEVESIRSRFRLMTMERSPSDSSLEKIERSEIKEMVNQETIILQMKETFEREKEAALSLAIAQETQKWEKLLEEKLEELRLQHESDKEAALLDFGKRISEEKDKQIEILREREANLNLECIKYKSTILQLTDCDSSHGSDLLLKLETLEKEKEQLQVELEKIKRIISSSSQEMMMASSIAICEGKVDAATSPVRQQQQQQKEKLTSSQASLIKSGTISVDSCKVGDHVLVLWNPKYQNYVILQESPYLFFLHSDCLESLGLKAASAKQRKIYCIGEVSDKEYCHAKRAENRFKVPKGTKFYRVQVKSLPNSRESAASLHDGMSQSQSSATTSSRMELADDSSEVSHSLPSSPRSALDESTVTLKKEEEDSVCADPESAR